MRKVIRGLMSKFGLKWRKYEAGFATIFDSGDGLVAYTDLDRTCQDVARYSQKDADHYEELGRAPTGFRAKTAILVPQLKRYYVAAPRHGQDSASVKVYEVR